MSIAFSPSINIIRDEQKTFQYIVTPNSKRITTQIQDDFKKGVRSFNIIGSYGTGKSSFLLAIEQTLSGIYPHFNNSIFNNLNSQCINIVGSYTSIIGAFAECLDVQGEAYVTENILSELFNKYHKLQGENPFLVIVVDELGKFLEYAANNNPEKELYFLQQLAEFVNNPKNNILLITTIHQSFEAYAYQLDKTLRQEWSKVKGRYKEIVFNEPVEQLLYLASEHISKIIKAEATKGSINNSFKIFKNSKAFKIEYNKEVALKLYPLDILAANVLTLALQRYGQNERSLFSFLESTDTLGIGQFKKNQSSHFYNLANVFDYLISNFFSFLHSKYNPDFASWSAIKISIEQVENAFDQHVNDYLKLVKTIGLLNNFSNAGSVLDEMFLTEYAEVCLGIKYPQQLIEQLTAKNIIRYRKHSKRFVLTEETEVDIELALIEANNSLSEITDIPSVLKKYFEFAPVLAKEYSYLNGTNRYFHFEITDHPKQLIPNGEIDGYIQLIFEESGEPKTVEIDSANIFVYYKNAKEIRKLLFDLEKIQKVLNENQHDKVAKRELESIIFHQKALLNHFILHSLYSGSQDITWYWNNKLVELYSKKKFNQLLTQVCNTVYHAAPIFKNELVNKHKISSAIHTAKRNYFKGLVNCWDQIDLGIPENKFPPEKMIYKSLLQDNGLTPYGDEEQYKLSPGHSFFSLWQISNDFLNGTKGNKKSLVEFTKLLSQKPFKLKQGFIDFWIPTFLFLKRDDFALYADHVFVPAINENTLELMTKKPKDFHVKAFDIDGVRLNIFNSYRTFLNQEIKDSFGNISFIETIKPFLIFYKTLPEYAKYTNRLSKPALAIREAIAKSKDPETTFFDAFPLALGTSTKDLNDNPSALINYIETLQSSIKEIRTCFEDLIERFDEFIKQEILFEHSDLSFEETKLKLQTRYSQLKRHLLLPTQRSFVQRIDSQLDDKRAWLSSLSQALIGKSLETVKDEDEILICDAFKNMIHELDSLTELSTIEIDEGKEQIYNIQLATFGQETVKSMIRISKKQTGKLNFFIQQVEEKLTNDTEINKVILTKLLQKLLNG